MRAYMTLDELMCNVPCIEGVYRAEQEGLIEEHIYLEDVLLSTHLTEGDKIWFAARLAYLNGVDLLKFWAYIDRSNMHGDGAKQRLNDYIELLEEDTY
jgi:hypothetical protein